MNFLNNAFSADFDQLKNTSLSTLVRDRLLSKILTGDLAPGQPIREPEIVEELQVSRVPVREALRQLESLGLVVTKKNCGASVRSLSVKEIEDLYAFRAVLDGVAGTQVCLQDKAHREQLAHQLSNLCAQMSAAIEADNTQQYYNLNLHFHWLFIDALGNEEIKKTYREIIQKLHLARFTNLKNIEHRQQSNQEHMEIVQALRAADTPKAVQRCARLLSNHVQQALQRLLQT